MRRNACINSRRRFYFSWELSPRRLSIGRLALQFREFFSFLLFLSLVEFLVSPNSLKRGVGLDVKQAWRNEVDVEKNACSHDRANSLDAV